MFELILKLSLAHLLGDFVFQTDAMVKDIDKNKWQSPALYLHAAIHFILLLLCTQLETQYILPALLLTVTHLGIDMLTKIILKMRIKSISNLLIDQALHGISIALFVRYFYDYTIELSDIFNAHSYLLAICLISITYVASVFIKKTMEMLDFIPGPEDVKHIEKYKGLKDAGMYIGMLERLFIFMFILLSFWEGIGFLLAAKSIFRFGDLRENKEIKLTEYILIGTLLSFGIAIAAGLAYLKLKAYLIL